MLERWTIHQDSTGPSEAGRDFCRLAQIPEYVTKTNEYMCQAGALQSQAERTSLLVGLRILRLVVADVEAIAGQASGLPKDRRGGRQHQNTDTDRNDCKLAKRSPEGYPTKIRT